MLPPQGWQCPECKHIYAPHVDECKRCPTKVEMTQTEIKQAFRDIGLALDVNNGAVATDRPDIDTWDVKWTLNFDKELEQLNELEKFVAECIGDVWVSLN